VPKRTGLFTFWVIFSTDGGNTWSHDSVPDSWVLVDPPQVDGLRMYTLIPSVSGSMSDWAGWLTHIKSMGFNAVHLLPLTTLDTSHSPYSAKNLFDVDPSYLAQAAGFTGLQQLENFLQATIDQDIRLCFDLVMNHVGVDSHIAKLAPDWIMPDPESPDGLRRARYWCDKGWMPWNDLVLIDYEHPSQKTREKIHNYMTEYALFWSHYAAQTNGLVRFDNLHSSNKQFVSSLTKKLHAEYPNVAILAEYFTDSNTLLETIPQWGLNLVLATPWDSRFVPQLREYLKFIHSVSQHVRFMMPITSHDSGSPAQEFADARATFPRYVAAALLGTGATGITQGVEWGVKSKIEFIGKAEKLRIPDYSVYASFIKAVNQILVDHAAFRIGGNCEFVDANHEAVIAAFRKDPRPDKRGFLVICNFDILNEHAFEADLTKLLPETGVIKARELISGEEKTFTSRNICLVLPKFAAMVWMLE